MAIDPLPVLDLKPDCERCCGLCCVAPAFVKSSDFAITKPPGRPCPKLTPGFRCSIHARLRPEGFPGCVAYDCFGAGQKVTQVTFGGQTWRGTPKVAGEMFDVFGVMQQIHSMLHYLTEALGFASGPLHDDLQQKLAELEVLSLKTPQEILAVDMAAQRQAVGAMLDEASRLVRVGS
ncbi:MAG TPA: hypothetical protein VHL54_12340 [Actinomycetota bacterium]|nr:hypothetical protein [Actinomycetota bacterium]